MAAGGIQITSSTQMCPDARACGKWQTQMKSLSDLCWRHEPLWAHPVYDRQVLNTEFRQQAVLVCCTVYFSVLAIVDWRKTGTHDLLDARQRRLCNILVSSRSDHFSSLRCWATESIVTLINDLCRRSAVGNSAALSASAFSHVSAAVPQVERRTRCVKGHDIVQEGLRFTTTIWIVF